MTAGIGVENETRVDVIADQAADRGKCSFLWFVES